MAATIYVPIDQRFAQLIQQFGLTKNSFAISLGKTASVVQHLIDGRNKPGYDLLCRVFEIYPNVSRDWLLLGRGPMLVGGEFNSKLTVAPVTTPPISAVPEPQLEPIDLSDVELSVHRRLVPGVAGSRLQPSEIAATLALAAAAQPGPATATVSVHTPEIAAPLEAPAPLPEAVPPAFFATPAANAPLPQAPPVMAPVSPVPAVVSAPVAVPVAPGPAPEIYVAAALNAQYLQHQLAMAELRNQHLVEQQQMLREMLAMARQAMV